MAPGPGYAVNIADLVSRHATARPNDTSFICGERSFTWRHIDERTDTLAAWLAERLPPGERVALIAGSCHRYWEVHYACAKAGLPVVPVNHRLTPAEMVSILDDVGAGGLVTDLAVSRLDVGSLAADGRLGVLVTIGREHPAATPYDAIIEEGRPAPSLDRRHEINVVGYTSGTTGRTKGAVIGHHCSVMSAMWFAALYGLRPDDVFLACMPAYVYRGGGGGFASAVVGATTLPLGFDATAVLGAIERYRVTHAILAPAMVDRLIAHPDLRERDLSSLRGLWIGGAPSRPSSLSALAEVVGDILGSVYGMTEATGIASMRWSVADDDTSRRRLTSVGRPAPIVDLRLVGSDGAPVDVGEPGEIVVRGDSVMDGYWGEGVGGGLDDGWFATGDVAVRDTDGYLYLVDRRSDVVNSGGLNVYSVEVERVLAEHPSIEDCSVVGAPDATWGETVCAFVVGRGDARVSLDDVENFCAGRLARFKIPRVVIQVDELPRNAMGKIDKKALRARLWGGEERQIAGA